MDRLRFWANYSQWRCLYRQSQPFPPSTQISIPEYHQRFTHISQTDLVCVKLIGTTRCPDDQPSLLLTSPNDDDSSPQPFVFHLSSADDEAQVLADPRKLMMKTDFFSRLYSFMKTGVVVAVSGFPGKSESGNLYLLATDINISSGSVIGRPKRPLATRDSFAARTSELDLDLARRMKEELKVERKMKKDVYRIRSKFVKYMRKFLYESEFMNVVKIVVFFFFFLITPSTCFPIIDVPACQVKAPITLDMCSCMTPRPEWWFHSLLFGGGYGYGAGNNFRILRNFGQKDEFTPCTFFKSFRNEALMELTEQLLSGIIKKLTGGYKIKYHANGLGEEPIEFDFSLPFRRIDLIEELEKTANLTLPEDLSSDSAQVYLSDTCIKYGIECQPPRSSANLLNKLVEKFVESDCIRPTFVTNHPNLRVSFLGDCGVTDHFELFINKNMICSGHVVLEDPSRPYRMKFPIQLKEQGESTSLAQREVELCRTGWWIWKFNRIIMMFTDKQDIKEVNCSIFAGYECTRKKKKLQKKKKKMGMEAVANTTNPPSQQFAAPVCVQVSSISG